MSKYTCNMNRLDWDGNTECVFRRGDVFGLDDPVRAQTLLDAGYIAVAPEQPDIVEPTKSEIPDDTWTVAELKDRLDQMNVDYPTRGTKAELIEIVNGGSLPDSDTTQESPDQ